MIIILIIILFLLFYGNKSKFENENNILVMACHFKNKYKTKIVKNNLSKFNNFTVILVYSTEIGDIDFSEFNNFTVIHDKLNTFYDFGKYKLAYNYIKQNNLNFNKILVMNDSIFIADNISWITEDILKNTTDDFIGILETNDAIFENTPLKVHYQSWWLTFNKRAFNYWAERIVYDSKYSDILNLINDLEINLCNEMIRKFKSSAIFKKEEDHNIFIKPYFMEKYFYGKNFKFLKIKHQSNLIDNQN
jgi:hypothetical protein